MKSQSLLWFCFVAAIVALSICGCKKSSDIEANTIEQAQTTSSDQEQSEQQVADTKGKGLSNSIIQKVIKKHSGELRACYEDELSNNPELAGKIICQWTISGNGEVTDSSIVQSELSNENVEMCILNSIKHWEFPAPKGGGSVKIEYPFVFNSNDQGQSEQQVADTKNKGLSKSIIQKVIRQHSDELRACYEIESSKKEGTARIVCQWTISENGEVTEVSIVQSDMNNENVEMCILDNISGWRFPAPKGNGIVSIEYPFIFDSDERKYF